MFYIGVFIIGCIFGSFSNVCIFRLPNNKKISKGRSFCINCKKEINWFDNLPLLSFVILKGKCRYCNNSISFQYFLVELIAGLSFIYIYHFFGFSITSVLYKIHFSFLKALSAWSKVVNEIFKVINISSKKKLGFIDGVKSVVDNLTRLTLSDIFRLKKKGRDFF